MTLASCIVCRHPAHGVGLMACGVREPGRIPERCSCEGAAYGMQGGQAYRSLEPLRVRGLAEPGVPFVVTDDEVYERCQQAAVYADQHGRSGLSRSECVKGICIHYACTKKRMESGVPFVIGESRLR